MSKEIIITDQDIIKWCDEKTKDGTELAISWDGGNDSGSYRVLLGDTNIYDWDKEEDIPSLLIAKAESELDYGSFAGDFYTSGKLTYDRDTKTFNGTDEYETTDTEDFDNASFMVKVPKDLWFDRVTYNYEFASFGQIEDVNVTILVDNGPVSTEHETCQELIKEQFQEYLEKLIYNMEASADDIDSGYNEGNIEFKDFTLEGDHYVHTITELSYTKRTCSPRDITINLNDDEF